MRINFNLFYEAVKECRLLKRRNEERQNVTHNSGRKTGNPARLNKFTSVALSDLSASKV